MDVIATGLDLAAALLERVGQLNARYRAGEIHAPTCPSGCATATSRSRTRVARGLRHQRALDAGTRTACSCTSLPVAFEPGESVGPYLAIVDRDEAGEPYRFLDMGALIATHAFGENDPAVVRAVLDSLPFVTDRYAHLRNTRRCCRCGSKAGAGSDRARRNAAAFRGQHRRGGGRERDQSGAHEPRDDLARRRRRLHRVLRRRVSRPHARRTRGDAPQEGAPRVSDVRLAAHSVSG